MNLSSIGTSGMFRAAERFENSAIRIANGSAGTGVDLATEIVEMKQAETQFAVSTQVVRAANDMTGKLLDILA